MHRSTREKCAGIRSRRSMTLIALRPPAPPAPIIALVVMLLASAIMFVTIIRRWTSHRMRFALADWARENGFRVRGPGISNPLPAVPVDPNRIAKWILQTDGTTVIQLAGRGAADGERWNLLIRRTITSWSATALRPVAAARSAIELFSLEQFPLLPVNERFTLWGADHSSARALGSSPVAGLLPADIGLVLLGDDLIV